MLASACTDRANSADSERDADSVEGSPSTDAQDSPDAFSDEGDSDGGNGEPGGSGEGDGVEPGDSATMELLADLPGQLAIGDGTRVLVGRPDGKSLVEIDGGSDTLASQPTWSRSGRQLVWTSATPEQQVTRVLEFDDDGAPVGQPLESNASGPPIFYYQWSLDDERLLYLRNSPAGAQVEAGWLAPGRDAVPVAVGTPFFASWSPGGDLVAVHRNNFEIGVFDTFTVDTAPDDPELVAPVAQLPRTRGEFTTPGWIDDRRFVVVSNGSLAVAEVAPSASSLEVVAELVPDVGSIRLVVSPDRTKVAYQRPIRRDPEIVEASIGVSQRLAPVPIQDDAGALVVLDLATGAEAVVTEEAAVAWEWSPDGSRLAWLDPDRAGLARWQFWSIDPAVGANLAGNAEAPSLRLSRKYLNNYLPFFAQYTHSVTGWAPDSSAFVTAGSADGVAAIWMQLVDVASPAVPIAEGDFVTWGGGPTPPTSGAPIT